MPRIADTSIERFNEISMNKQKCPACDKSKNVRKSGKRQTKDGRMIQIYKCIACGRTFSTQPIPGASYPPKIIAFALSYFNIGHTLEETRTKLKRDLKTSVPVPTIHDWTKRHEKLCTFIWMRRKYDLDWRTTITTKKLYHQQVFEFKYHDLKTNIAAKAFPQMRTYLKNIASSGTRKPSSERIMTKIFKDSSVRCSTFKPPIDPQALSKEPKTKRSNNATEMTRLALTLARNRAQRHEAVESFFIANDSSTIAVEVPVYILPEEATDLKLKEPLTGHIDIVQFRNNKIQILDYKPDRNPRSAHTQLYLYKRALSKRTGIPLNSILTAAFNEDGYAEFKD